MDDPGTGPRDCRSTVVSELEEAPSSHSVNSPGCPWTTSSWPCGGRSRDWIGVRSTAASSATGCREAHDRLGSGANSSPPVSWASSISTFRSSHYSRARLSLHRCRPGLQARLRADLPATTVLTAATFLRSLIRDVPYRIYTSIRCWRRMGSGSPMPGTQEHPQGSGRLESAAFTESNTGGRSHIPRGRTARRRERSAASRNRPSAPPLMTTFGHCVGTCRIAWRPTTLRSSSRP